MEEPVSFDWKSPLEDVLWCLRREYASRFPALASERLDLLLERMRHDDAQDWLPVLGQEVESLGLALVEACEGDDAIRLHVVEQSCLPQAIEWIESTDCEAVVHRQEEQPFGAPACFPAPCPLPLVPLAECLRLKVRVNLDAGWAIGCPDDDHEDTLLDLRKWPFVRKVPSQLVADWVRCWVQGPEGLRAWIRTHWGNGHGDRRDELCYAFAPLEGHAQVHALPLPPPHSKRQRRDPLFALGFHGHDLLLVDRSMIFVYRRFGLAPSGHAPPPELVHTASPGRRPGDIEPAICRTEDGRICIFSRWQLFEWRGGSVVPLPLLGGLEDQDHVSQPVPTRSSCIAWLHNDHICEGDLASGHVTRYVLKNMPHYTQLRLTEIRRGWLLITYTGPPHRSSDIAQLWNLGTRRVARIRYGELECEGGIDHWTELPGGEIVVGDYARQTSLGTFDELVRHLERDSIDTA